MGEDKSQVKIRLFTKEQEERLQVVSAPLYTPVSLKRFGLSEIVNHLLKLEKPIPFEFLIDGELLRESLENYLVKKNLSREAVLNVEYTRAVLPPSYLHSFNNEDWVSALDVSEKKIVSGSYDGIVRIWNMDGKVEKLFSGHSGAIKAVRYISDTRLVSGGNDHTLSLFKTKSENSKDANEVEGTEEAHTLAILEGHSAPVVSIDVHKGRILSASYDNAIGFWSTNYKDMMAVDLKDTVGNLVSTAAKKRRKLALKDSSVRRRVPLSLLESHKAPVEQVIFDKNDSTVGYSVSHDHSIKTWDLVTARCVDTRTTSYPLLSMTQLSTFNLLACGSSARHITLHDPRVDSSASITQKQLIGHRNFVVSMDNCPENEYMLCSASHDGTVKVWDIRATAPIYTITREDSSVEKGINDKVFAVKWAKGIGIISGGQDKKIQFNKGDDIFKV